MVYADPSWIILPGRVAMILFALATIWLTWSLANRFFGPRAGIAAAALLAINPVHVTWSQIIRSDMMACTFMLLCLRSCAAIAEGGKWRDYRFAALWLGLAIATKWPFALASLAIGSATIFAVRTGALPPRAALLRLAGSAAGAIIILFVVSPYLLLDHATAMKNIQGEGQSYHLGANGGSVLYNLFWYLDGPLHAGFGLLGLCLVAFGAIQLHRHRQAMAVLMPVAIAFVILFCVQRLVWERWALPLMPIGAIVAAWGLIRLGGMWPRQIRANWVRWAPTAVLLAALVPLGARSLADGRARMNDTRQLASAWALKNIPPGSRVLIEHNAFDLIGQPWHVLFPMGNAGCVDVVALIHGRANYAVIEMARGGRSNLDYGTLPPARRADCRLDFAILSQADRYRQESGLFPNEDAAYRALIAERSAGMTFTPVPGRVGGPVVTIVDLRERRSSLVTPPIDAAK
ncbi:ArnT family glycosyltransferase [Sphingomonas sp. Leaf357]|uniref:ArnT family glycosyltransferase n=1 Tax=Sphingomonas sp. Leaf357 TaxID=1736350 RepID=UPI001F1C2F63|nr:glycosyltransferase family 39 protein [Sphingomonas sp. Leaf357]